MVLHIRNLKWVLIGENNGFSKVLKEIARNFKKQNLNILENPHQFIDQMVDKNDMRIMTFAKTFSALIKHLKDQIDEKNDETVNFLKQYINKLTQERIK